MSDCTGAFKHILKGDLYLSAHHAGEQRKGPLAPWNLAAVLIKENIDHTIFYSREKMENTYEHRLISFLYDIE